MYTFFFIAVLIAFAGSQPVNQTQISPAKLARSLVHKASWAAFGTISSDESLVGYPMVNVISIADNDNIEEIKNGEIFFMLTKWDYSGKDTQTVNKVTLLFSDDQNGECTRNGKEPMGHTCPRVHISGEVEKVDTNSPYYTKALELYLSRHKKMENVVGVSDMHGFYLCKLNIKKISLFAGYNPPIQNIDLNSYFSENLN